MLKIYIIYSKKISFYQRNIDFNIKNVVYSRLLFNEQGIMLNYIPKYIKSCVSILNGLCRI